MPNHVKAQVRDTALSLLTAAPSGLRYRELHRALCDRLPGISPHVVADAIQTLRHSLPPGFSVMKGVYRKEINPMSAEQADR